MKQLSMPFAQGISQHEIGNGQCGEKQECDGEKHLIAPKTRLRVLRTFR